jgi:hypothetical protein
MTRLRASSDRGFLLRRYANVRVVKLLGSLVETRYGAVSEKSSVSDDAKKRLRPLKPRGDGFEEPSPVVRRRRY